MIGIVAGNSATTVIVRSTVVMLVCWVIGFFVGAVAQHIVQDHIDRYKSDHPITSDDQSAPTDQTTPGATL